MGKVRVGLGLITFFCLPQKNYGGGGSCDEQQFSLPAHTNNLLLGFAVYIRFGFLFALSQPFCLHCLSLFRLL